MIKQFNIDADTITTQIAVTNGFFDGGVGTLAGSNLTTSSLSATQKSYYYPSFYLRAYAMPPSYRRASERVRAGRS